MTAGQPAANTQRHACAADAHTHSATPTTSAPRRPQWSCARHLCVYVAEHAVLSVVLWIGSERAHLTTSGQTGRRLSSGWMALARRSRPLPLG